MALIASNVATLLDHAKRMDPDGKIADIVENLNQENEILSDMLWREGNLTTGHRTTVRTGLPTATWRLLNKGVATSKSTTAQIDEGCGMLEARSSVDKDLAMLNGNTAAFRLSEASAFLEAMNQEFTETLFYGNVSSSPQEITGLAPRFNSLSAENARNIVSAGGSDSGDLTSIWLVGWGQKSVHGIFPKGSTAGLIHEDLGEGDEFDSDNNRYRAFMDRYQWKCGIALRDWRYVVRIANIDVSASVTKTSAPDVIEAMIKATHRMQSMKGVKCAWYMNRTMIQVLDTQRRDAIAAGGGLSYENVDGMVQPYFRKCPIRTVDGILTTEATVS